MMIRKSFGCIMQWVVVSFLVLNVGVYAQESGFGNSISGTVYGVDRQPLTDMQLELLDDFSRTVMRTRTRANGQFSFSRLPAGRYKIRVFGFGTNYLESVEEVPEIINFTRANNGGVSTGGFSNEIKDIYMRLRKGADSLVTGALFVQEVPDDAKKLYDKAIADLDAKKDDAGLAGLRATLEIFPKHYYALERLGSEYVQLGHFEAAEILLTIAVGVNPRGYRSWYGLAYSQYSQQKYEAGSVSADKAIELEPSSGEAMALSGALLRYNKKYAEAEKRMLKAVKLLNDTNPQIHWELALLYGRNLNRYADAAKELKLFLKAQPKSKDAEMITKLIAEFEKKAETK